MYSYVEGCSLEDFFFLPTKNKSMNVCMCVCRHVKKVYRDPNSCSCCCCCLFFLFLVHVYTWLTNWLCVFVCVCSHCRRHRATTTPKWRRITTIYSTCGFILFTFECFFFSPSGQIFSINQPSIQSGSQPARVTCIWMECLMKYCCCCCLSSWQFIDIEMQSFLCQTFIFIFIS